MYDWIKVDMIFTNIFSRRGDRLDVLDGLKSNPDLQQQLLHQFDALSAREQQRQQRLAEQARLEEEQARLQVQLLMFSTYFGGF